MLIYPYPTLGYAQQTRCKIVSTYSDVNPHNVITTKGHNKFLSVDIHKDRQ